MSSSLRPVLLGSLAVVLLAGAGQAQDRRRPADASDVKELRQRVIDLENELAAVRKELKEVRRQVQARPQLTVVPVKNVDAASLTQVLTKLFVGDRNDVSVAVVPNASYVIVCADAETTRNIKIAIQTLDRKGK
jgi:outer membrane murein-binding lipoprotein Lpp